LEIWESSSLFDGQTRLQAATIEEADSQVKDQKKMKKRKRKWREKAKENKERGDGLTCHELRSITPIE
jgi:hypothetical protein